MARRSDYTREELTVMAIDAGQRIITEEGFAKFSARKVAREIGYTIGTIYNIFDSHDDFILHINAVTLRDMAAFINKKVTDKDQSAVKQMAEGYIEFAQNNYNRWSALFEHNLPAGVEPPKWYQKEIKQLFDYVEQQFVPVVDNEKEAEIAARTIWAGIHGICQLSLTGKLDVVGVKSIKKLTDSLIENYLQGLQN